MRFSLMRVLEVSLWEFFDYIAQILSGLRVTGILDDNIFFYRVVVLLKETAESFLEKIKSSATGQTESDASIFHPLASSLRTFRHPKYFPPPSH